MAEPRERSESLGDSTEDNPLTIRLPNPRSFLARQSQWKGRRGKPRCDHCRLNNLKVSHAYNRHTFLLRSHGRLQVRQSVADLQPLFLGKQRVQVYSSTNSRTSWNPSL